MTALADLRAENAALKARVSELEGALARTRSSLQTELDRGVITDTLWMNDVMSETIFDALDSALSRTKKEPSNG